MVVVVTSDKCYANLEHDRGYRESDPMAGRDPYSASKGMAELATAAYREAFFPADESANHGVRVASARAGNVIGGGDWSADRLLPDVIAALAEDCAPELRHPEAVRPWQHVLEPLSGYLTLAGRMLTSADPEWPSAWNFGPRREDSVAVGEVTDMALQAWGAGEWRRRPSEGDPHEASLLYLDIEKSTTVLGWRPRWPVREAVERAVAWYRAYYVQRPASMRARCESDIAANEAAMTEETRG